MSARARKISFGADSVKEEIIKRKAYLVIVSEESSERTKDKFQKLCNEYNIPIIIAGSIEELSKSIGKDNKATFAIKDINLANEIIKIFNGGEVIG
ncbi:MAG: ribosomal L7Ae/L30e/S12e/Gadd45 family protein [Clostridia bacterium]|nr:ribosomal L7Ae/L30e/S12e/Gadd45 family protein [Clostridia bacterium]